MLEQLYSDMMACKLLCSHWHAMLGNFNAFLWICCVCAMLTPSLEDSSFTGLVILVRMKMIKTAGASLGR